MTSDESSGQTQQTIDPGKNQPGVLCGHCDHLNCGGLTACEVCGTLLYAKCAHCGLEAPRVYMRCPQCRHRLRGHTVLARRRSRDKLRRAPSSIEKANRQLIWVLALVVVIIAVATVVVMRLKG